MKPSSHHKGNLNTQHLRADSLSLLLSALRPCVLVGVLLFGVFLFAQSAYTSDVSAASITLSVPTTALSVDLNPSSNNGFAKSSASAVSVKADGSWGYDFSIKSKTGSNTLKNEASGGLLESITTSAGGINEETFKSEAGYNNKWGFLPSKLNSTANEKYQAGPATSMTIDKTSTANDGATSYNISMAAKADVTLASGTYTNTFVLTATANTVSYNITYNLNSGSWSGANQSGNTTSRTITLDTHTPTREGYEFKGWCDKATADETCSGNRYDAGGTYTLNSGTNALELYAMWGIAIIPGQPAECKALTKIGQTGTFTDPRDNNKYTIARLKDGKCWMTQNLRIVGKTINSTNSDMSSGSYTIPASNINNFVTSSSNITNEAAYYGGTENYGAHYTWQTATAGTGSNYATQNQNAPSSICPKGWKLPTGGSDTANSDFGKLVTAYGGDNSIGSQNLRASPVNFSYAGYVGYSDGSLNNQGSYGYYWSSTVYGSTVAYDLDLNSSRASPASSSSRVYGHSARCVARDE